MKLSKKQRSDSWKKSIGSGALEGLEYVETPELTAIDREKELLAARKAWILQQKAKPK